MAKNQMQRRQADDGEYGDLPARGQGGGQLQSKQTVQTLGAFLSAGREQFANALPKHMTPERLMRTALTAATKNPKLLECRPESFALALLNAAALGLETNGRDAHLVPYGDQVTLIPDYKGLVQLAYRSSQVAGVTAKAVYKEDDFAYELGTDEFLRHKPSEKEDPGPLVYAWAMCRFKDGASKFVVLNRRDVMRRKAASKSANRSDSPWKSYEESMWAKSAVRELAKWIPQVAELAQAVAMEEAAERGDPQLLDEHANMKSIFGNTVDEPTPETKSDALANRLGGDEQPETPQNALSEGTRLIEAMRNAPSAAGFALAWKACQQYSGWTDAENQLADQVYEERGNYWAGVEAAAKRKAEQGSLIDKGSPEYE